MPLESRTGIAYGEVIQGPIGRAQGKEFTVIGDVVNTAERLELTKDAPIGLTAPRNLELCDGRRVR